MTSRKNAPHGVAQARALRPGAGPPPAGAPPAGVHNHADQFGKSLLRDALSAASTPETEVEVVAATQKIDAWEPSIAGPLVIHFRLTSRGTPGTKEDDVSAELRAWFEDFKRSLLDEGRDEGRREGRVEEAARALLTVLRGRGIAVPDAARDRILAARDPARIERWIEKASIAASLADVLDEPSLARRPQGPKGGRARGARGRTRA